VEHSEWLAQAMSRIGLGRAPASLLIIGDHYRVELVIVVCDTRQVELY